MKRGILFLFGAFLLIPSLSLADAGPTFCANKGYTVVFVNGIFNTKLQAQEDVEMLQFRLGHTYGSQDVNVRLGYNQTHLAGAGDLIESYFPSFDTYDLNTILLQIYPEVTTQKLLVVGHSQGSVYANKIYEYLTGHGAKGSSLGVYAVGTPDSYVAGGGKYLTYALDPVINKVRMLSRFNPLPANIDLVDLSPDAPIEGHSFINQYLAGASGRIVSDIQGELSQLKAGDVVSGGCFTPPTVGVAYKAEQAALAVSDPLAVAVRNGSVAVAHATVAVAQKSYQAAASAASAVGNLFSFNIGTPQQDVATFEVVKALYGSSLSETDVEELLGAQGGAVATAPAAPKPQTTPAPGLVLGAQTTVPSPAAATPAPAHTTVTLKSKKKSSDAKTEAPVEAVVAEPVPDATSTATSTDESVEEEAPATTTPAVDEATTTPRATLSFPPESYIIASNQDESSYCYPDWRECYTEQGPEQEIDLGKGSDLGDGSILSVTIAKQDDSQYTDYPWYVFIRCYVDAAHTQTCPDWIEPNAWDSRQTYILSEQATTTVDHKYWTAYFTNPDRESNYLGSDPVRFKPEYYYTLAVNDNGWNIGAYGSPTQVYWVLRGMPRQFYTIASQPDESFLCANTLLDGDRGWLNCLTPTPEWANSIFIPLGKGSDLGGGTIHSATVALDVTVFDKFPYKEYYSNFEKDGWNIFIYCYTDPDYTQTCPDWLVPTSWNGHQTFELGENTLSHSDDKKYWTSYFDYDPSHGTNSDGTFPPRFYPDYYYRLLIADGGWEIGAYGSPTEPYWVLTGEK